MICAVMKIVEAEHTRRRRRPHWWGVLVRVRGVECLVRRAKTFAEF